MLRVVVVLLLMAPLTGRAAAVAVEFEGVLDRVWDDFGLFGDATEGTPFSGTYFYDDAIAGNICEGVLTLDQCAVYDFTSQASAGMTLEFGGASFSFSNADGGLRTPRSTALQRMSTRSRARRPPQGPSRSAAN